MARELPAFGRTLQAAIRAGREPRDIVIFIDRWPPKKRPLKRPPLAVLPGDDPSSLDWSLCAGRDVIIPAADEADRDRLRSTVQAIRAAGSRRLVLLGQGAPEFIVSARGAA